MQSTAGKNKSYFYDDIDAEKLYYEYKMTGKFRDKKKGKEANFELINLPDGSHYGVDYYTGNKINAFTIHYGKTGSHIIPSYHEEG